MAAPRGFLEIEGLSPEGDKGFEFWIAKDVVDKYYRNSQLNKVKELHIAKEILQYPAVIFEGLSDEEEEGYAYAGLGSRRLSKDGDPLPPPTGKTFVVKVLKPNRIYWWGWDEADPRLLTYPLAYQQKYGHQLWPRT